MGRLRRWVGALDDRLNPVLIKELRQAVRARSVTILLLLLLLVLLVTILGLFLLNADPAGSGGSDLGQGAFLTILGILQVTTVVLVPAVVAARITGERQGSDLQLMLTATLKPSAIITGKLLSGLVVAVLLYSVATPFMTFTYLLRGIDLLTIFVLVLLSFLPVAPAIQLAIVLACLPLKVVARTLLLVGAALLGLYVVPMFLIVATRGMVTGGLGMRVVSGGALLAIATFVAAILLLLVFLYSLTWAALAPPASARALPVRLVMTAVWLVAGLVSLLWASARGGEAMLPWLYTSVIVLSFAMLAGVSQRDHLSPRVLASAPRRWWQRWPAFLLYGGSAGGLLWAVTMLLATEVVLYTGNRLGLWLPVVNLSEHLAVGLAIGIYGAGYALLGLLLHRWILANRVRPGLTWLLGLALMATLALVAVVVDILVSSQAGPSSDLSLWRACNPFALGHEVARATAIYFGGPTVILLMFLARSWLWQQAREYQPSLAPTGGQR